MKIKDLFEGEVVQGKFGKSHEVNTDIEIPKGYESFHVKKISDKVSAIIGVKKGGKEVQISTGHSELMDKLAKEYNSGGKGGTGIKPITMTQAFGSSGLNIIVDNGFKLLEKPGYFEDMENEEGKYKPISEIGMKKIEREFKKAGQELKTYTSKEIFGSDPRGPLQSFRHKPEEMTFIIEFSNGKRYLVDRTGASSYIRMWAYIES